MEVRSWIWGQLGPQSKTLSQTSKELRKSKSRFEVTSARGLWNQSPSNCFPPHSVHMTVFKGKMASPSLIQLKELDEGQLDGSVRKGTCLSV